MRERLAAIAGVRSRFRGRFERWGSASVRFRINGRRCIKEVKTLVLVNVTDTKGNELTDHLWFKCGKQFEDLELSPGDQVEFAATVEKYFKRRRDELDGETYFEGDFCLKRPAKMVKLDVGCQMLDVGACRPWGR